MYPYYWSCSELCFLTNIESKPALIGHHWNKDTVKPALKGHPWDKDKVAL
jgi:hypothetical protein